MTATGGEVHLANPDGRRVDLSIDQHSFSLPKQRDTLTIDGRFDYGDSSLGIGFPHGRNYPKIRVNMTRGAAVIAREIERRFLPDYNALRAEIAERVRKAAEYRDTQSGIADRLAAVVVGCDLRCNGEREFRLLGGAGNSRHVEVKVMSGEVDIKIENLTETEAGEVLRLLAPYLAKRKAG